MDEQAVTLLATLKRTAATVDAKLNQLNTLKSSIKHQSIPESAQPATFECIKLAITSQISPSLVLAGFSALRHLVKRLQQQDQVNVLQSQGAKLFPAISDRLGDPRENHRIAAAQAFSDLYPSCTHAVENAIRDSALVGNNARAKEAGMRWVERMSRDEGLHFRSFVPHVVDCLEDSDGNVRETAKSVIVELFRHAPEHAKADLKKQLSAHNVRTTISSQILSQISPIPQAEPDLRSSTQSAPVLGHSTNRKGLGDSTLSEHPPVPEVVPMDPLYVHTQRELEGMFQDMQPHFVGKETEQNWQARDKAVTKLRRLISGNAPTDFHLAFLTGVRSMLDGILGVSNTLRTVPSSNGCYFVQDLAKAFGPSLDSMIEMLLQNFIKMCSSTKQITAQNGNATVENLLAHVTYNARQMQHIWGACHDKNVQPRIFASNWLKTVLKKTATNKAHFEHTGGPELAEKCVRVGLADSHPKVREGMRSTFWSFAGPWAERAEAIKVSLDDTARLYLEKDPANPNPTQKIASLGESKNSTSNPKLKAAASRSSLKETIAAQKRAAAAKKPPERPSSAMSSFSPVRSTVSTSHLRQASTLSSSTSQHAPSSMSTSTSRPSAPSNTSNPVPAVPGSLLSAPLRRFRRPELPRPATADPYANANRRPIKAETPRTSPGGSPKRGDDRLAASTAGIITPKASGTHVSPSKAKTPSQDSQLNHSSIEAAAENEANNRTMFGEENFTMIIPNMNSSSTTSLFSSASRTQNLLERPNSTGSISGHVNDTAAVNISGMRFAHGTEPPPSTPAMVPSRQNTPGGTMDRHRPTLPHSPRLGSPLKQSDAKHLSRDMSSTHGSPVRVFEDPVAAHEDNSEAGSPKPEKAVLEELPLNEKSLSGRPLSASHEGDKYPESPTRQSRTPKVNGDFFSLAIVNGGPRLSPMQDKSESVKVGRLLRSGIDRIQTKTLDVHGFRRIRDLVKGNSELWSEDENLFRDLAIALLNYLQAPNEQLNTTQVKVAGLKTQALAILRAIIALHRRQSAPYLPRILSAVLIARGQFEGSLHIVTDLERAADEIVQSGRMEKCMSAILDLIDTDALDPSAATITMGFNVMSRILRGPQTRKCPLEISVPLQDRLAALAVRFLDDLHPDVRRADLEFCIDLHEWIRTSQSESGAEGEETRPFWERLGGVGEGRMNLIAYYVARRESAR